MVSGSQSFIVVDDSQAGVILGSHSVVEIRDREGRVLGVVAHPITEADIAVAKRRHESAQPRLTTSDVLEHLRSLNRP